MIIDLRSDTVTKPNAAMLKAMVEAPVGDDVFMEDSTVIALENKTAKMFGMEAGLFCPSGTMTNQVAIKTHVCPGEEIICEENAHIYHYETGGVAMNSGAQLKLIKGINGKITPNQISENINPPYDWLTITKLVSIENTGNRAGGNVYSLEEMKALADTCKKHKLPFHLDGARIFNALLASNNEPYQLKGLFDSISVCLSKGLGAPAGSVLLGDSEYIKKARRFRKAFGGGMRQSGILAAAGIYALDNNIKRLANDHENAKIIEQILKRCQYVETILPVHTNIIIFKLKNDLPIGAFLSKLSENHIKAVQFGIQTVRMVTHLDITNDMLPVIEKSLLSI